MKIIHTGDIHLGSPFKNLSADKAKIRKQELLDSFFKLCAYAKETGVRAVCISGDLFDENAVAGSLKEAVFSAIERAKPVCFFYVSGNHDECVSFDSAPDNLYTFSDSGAWKSYDLGEGVLVTGLHTKYFSGENFSALTLPVDAFNLLLLHGDIYNRSKELIPFHLLETKPVDYLALGHIHKPMLSSERIGLRGVYRYCGCLESRGFDEAGARGFFLLDIQNRHLREEKFLSFATRGVWELAVDISACATYQDIESAVKAYVQNIKKDDMVKIVLCGRYSAQLKKDISLLQERLNGAFFSARVEDTSRLEFSYRDFENDYTERGEFVREVLRAGLPDERKESVLEVGLKALMGEEIDL